MEILLSKTDLVDRAKDKRIEDIEISDFNVKKHPSIVLASKATYSSKGKERILKNRYGPIN